MSFEFRIETEEMGGALVVSVAGELDHATVAQLEQALDEAARRPAGGVLVDLAACEFIDSTGLGILVSGRERVLAGDGRGFAVCSPNAQVLRLLEITGIGEAMGVHESRDDALAALGAA